jgi:hypothetical protein
MFKNRFLKREIVGMLRREEVKGAGDCWVTCRFIFALCITCFYVDKNKED